jgi:glycosyltransferase involved in cell wall biosynthesis
MKVVVVHNYYSSAVPSGENTAVDDELRLLPLHGVEVVPFVASSDDLLRSRGAAVRHALSPVVSPSTARRLRAVIARERPDVVHLHNVFPTFGPTVIAAAQAAGVPVVQTVHNRRLACVAGTQFRDGHFCDDCLGKRVGWPGVVHRCYRGSAAQSAVMVTSRAVHHGRWRSLAHWFAVSDSIAATLVAEGVPEERVSVKPNPVPDPGVAPLPARRRLLFAGRLDPTKGVGLLVDAWRSLPSSSRPALRVLGAGPMSAYVASVAAEEPDLEYLGARPPAEVYTHLAESSALAVPSIAGEGLPRILAESFASGRGVLATLYEPVASVIGTTRGWCVKESGLPDAIARLGSMSDGEVQAMSAAARVYYTEHFAPATVYAQQRAVYEALA